ncbi:MAG: hypothetical protein ACLPH3_23325 [Terracidiphilus sp.]
MLDAAVPVGNRYYWKSNFVDTLGDGLVEVLRRGADAMPSPYSLIMLFETKGAIRRVAKEKMAFIIPTVRESRLFHSTPTLHCGSAGHELPLPQLSLDINWLVLQTSRRNQKSIKIHVALVPAPVHR